MPSRNSAANTGELASRSPKETALASTERFSDMYASHRATIARQSRCVQGRRGEAADMVALSAGSPVGVPKHLKTNKKEPPLPAAQGDNREASNRVDRSHSMSRRWTITVMNEKA